MLRAASVRCRRRPPGAGPAAAVPPSTRAAGASFSLLLRFLSILSTDFAPLLLDFDLLLRQHMVRGSSSGTRSTRRLYGQLCIPCFRAGGTVCVAVFHHTVK
jgi:hypothetical protein